MDYTQQIIDYILTTESDDFWEQVEDGDWLSDDEREMLLNQGMGSKYELDIEIMKKLTTKHIYAAAYMADKGE
jgi:hypothetical protein